MKMIEEPNVGAILKAYVKKNRIFQSGWSRKQNINKSTVATYLKQKDMRIGTLFNICQVLEFNFFTEITALLPKEMLPVTENPLQAENTELIKQNNDLQVQVKTLKEALQLVGGK